MELQYCVLTMNGLDAVAVGGSTAYVVVFTLRQIPGLLSIGYDDVHGGGASKNYLNAVSGTKSGKGIGLCSCV